MKPTPPPPATWRCGSSGSERSGTLDRHDGAAVCVRAQSGGTHRGDRRSWRHLCQLEIHQCESVVERGPQLAGLRGREVALRLQHQERGGEAHIEPGIFGLKPPGRQFPCDDGRLHLLSALRTRSPARVMSAATCSSSVWMRLSTCAMSAARRPPSLATAGGRAFAERALGPAAGYPSAASISLDGRKRSAAFDTRTTSSARAVSTVTAAVIPGFSLRSGLGTSMIVT